MRLMTLYIFSVLAFTSINVAMAQGDELGSWGLISITPQPPVTYKIGSDDNSLLTYRFTIKNRTNSSINLFKIQLASHNIPDLGALISDCHAVLPAASSCTLTYTSRSPIVSNPPKNGISFLDSFSIDNDGGSKTSPPFGVTVYPPGRLGHFKFVQGGKEIGDLYLTSGSKDSITLQNSGQQTITDFKLNNIPSALKNDFTGSCLTDTSIAENKSCTLDYDIKTSNVNGIYRLSATGDDVDNDSQILGISIGARMFVVNRVASSATGSVANCAINPDGSLGDCSKSVDASGHLYSLVFNSTNTLAFLSIDEGAVRHFKVNPDGTFSGGSQSGNFAYPRFMAIDPTNNYLFVTISGGSGVRVLSCPIKDGSLGGCQTANQDFNFNSPQGIVFSPGNARIYIANKGDGTIDSCAVTNGKFSDCKKESVDHKFSVPEGIAFNSKGTRLYVANNSSKSIDSCVLNADGSIGVCQSFNDSLADPFGIAISPGGTRAYISHSDQNSKGVGFTSCALNSDGTFVKSPCQVLHSFSQPTGIYLAALPNKSS